MMVGEYGPSRSSKAYTRALGGAGTENTCSIRACLHSHPGAGSGAAKHLWAAADWLASGAERAAEERLALGLLPFVVTELVTMVIRGDNVDEQDVLGLGVHACDLYLVAGEHPPEGVKGGGEMAE